MVDQSEPVTLVPVGEDVLEALVQAATTGAAADEVTPPLDGSGAWTDQRVAWLRSFHRDRRAGLRGPMRECTWAVVAAGEVVGSVRLAGGPDDGVVETGAWLTRNARGRGLGRAAAAAVLGEAAAHGARAVRADTTADNRAALAVLEHLGFDVDVDVDGDGRHVRALLLLEDSPGSRSGRRPGRATDPEAAASW